MYSLFYDVLHFTWISLITWSGETVSHYQWSLISSYVRMKLSSRWLIHILFLWNRYKLYAVFNVVTENKYSNKIPSKRNVPITFLNQCFYFYFFICCNNELTCLFVCLSVHPSKKVLCGSQNAVTGENGNRKWLSRFLETNHCFEAGLELTLYIFMLLLSVTRGTLLDFSATCKNYWRKHPSKAIFSEVLN